jgi:hypothetical protein
VLDEGFGAARRRTLAVPRYHAGEALREAQEMNERVTRKTVAFTQPFFIEDLGREQAAGTYEVEIIEEPIDGLSFIDYRVVSLTTVLSQRRS